MKQVFERAGVLFGAEYTVGPDGLADVTSVRLLGVDYRPFGPELSGVFAKLAVVADEVDADGVLSAEPFMNGVFSEIQ